MHFLFQILPHERTLRLIMPDGFLYLPTRTSIRRRVRGLILITALLTGLFALGPPLLRAQTPDSLAQTDQMYRVETTDGQVVLGTLMSADDTEVVLDTKQLGEVTIERAAIESIEEISADRFRNGEYWFQNPQSTRYFFAPNALGIPQGEGYYQNTWILFNNVNYGVSDRFSIGAGTVPVFLFGAPAVPFWLLPKVSFSTPQEHLHLAGGAMLGGVLGSGASVGGGLLYGSATVGNRGHPRAWIRVLGR